MKLLFLNSIDDKTYGGMEEWIRLVATGLQKCGHEITVCGRRNSEFLKRLENGSSNIEGLGLDISGDFNPVTISKLKKLIEQKDINTVIVNFNKDVRLGGLAAKLSDNVSVIWSVGLDITKNSLAHKILTPRLVQGVIVPSHSLKFQIILYGYIPEEFVKVIPIGIPELPEAVSRESSRARVISQFSIPADSIICVTSGRFVEQKGHECLIESAPGIVEKNPNVIFLLLGDGPLRSKLEARISELKLQSHFVLAGMRSDVNEILPGCDIMIHPSIEEPFGIAILEGMRAGLPVVASKVGGIPEVIQENESGILVEPRNSTELTKAVNQLLADSALSKQMGDAGNMRWRNRFTYETMIGKIEEYLSSQIQKLKAYGKTQADRA